MVHIGKVASEGRVRCLVRGAWACSGDRDLEPQGNPGWLSLRACPHCYFIWCSKPHSAELFSSVSACKSVKYLLLSPFAERKLRLRLSDTPMVPSLVNSAAGLCVLFEWPQSLFCLCGCLLTRTWGSRHRLGRRSVQRACAKNSTLLR